MFYITVMQSPMYHQMTLEEFLFGGEFQTILNPNMTNTRTYEVERVSEKFMRKADVPKLIGILEKFNALTKELREKSREDLYDTFHIPKHSGGLRRIDAPRPALMNALRQLKTIFEEDFHALYHTTAFAYIRKRSTIDALKRHQANESKWFGKFDLSNFFGSTTLEFVMKMFSMVFPFSSVIENEKGRQELEKALELAFLNGGLPQGTPISPLITNIMMIPIDFKLSNAFRDLEVTQRIEHKDVKGHQRFIYTRYADDFLVSSRYGFKFREIEKFIVDTLESFGAPFTIKSAKTRYGSAAGSNWNLGLMLNGNNKITVGYKKKKQFQAMLTSFILDTKNGKPWNKEDIQTMEGYRNYYRMVEKDTIDAMVKHISDKQGVDVVKMIKEQLRAA